MARAFKDRLSDPVWWLEQAGHGWIGAAAALPTSSVAFALSHSPALAFAVGSITAALVGAARELAQNLGDSDNNVGDAVADSLFTWLGGVLASVPWGVAALV